MPKMEADSKANLGLTDVYWQTELSRADCEEYMFQHQLYTDTTLRVHLASLTGQGQVKDIECHEYVLRRESVVLADLLNDGPGVLTLHHPGIDEDIFMQFIR